MKQVILFLVMLFIALGRMNSENRQYAIFDASTGEKLDMKAFAERSMDFDVLYFGEFHDDTTIHDIQKLYLEALLASTKKLGVSFEMFERDAQQTVNDYLSGKINEEEFLKKSRPWPDYKIFYRPLIELAKTNKAPVIAANVPRMYAGMYTGLGMVGLDKLAPAQRVMIAKKMVIEEDDYFTNFKRTMLLNLGIDTNATLKPNQENTLYLYYGAQLIKDETMAESIVDFLSANDDFKVVHFNGDFHSNNYLGTVKKVIQRNKKLKNGVITPTYIETGKPIEFDKTYKGRCDFLIVLEEKKEKQEFTQAMMGGHFGENYIVSHKINITLDPTNHTLVGSDEFKFKNPILKKSAVKMLKDLKIESAKSPEGEIDFSVQASKSDSLYQDIIFTNKGKELSEIVLNYKGTIYHSPNVTLLNQRHSNTPGIISNAKGEGIYLPGGSYCPQSEKDLASFDITVKVPKDLVIITSGLMGAVINEGDSKIYNYQSELPADDFILVGGKYSSIDSTYEGKKFVVYTLENAAVAKTYLNASIDYYKMYTKVLGDYPFSSFKVVENFFATGFGMPGYTLLSNRLLAMPWIMMMPGSLAHEFVHNWWGNGVFVDYELGNWCEALTSFSTNYYYNVLANKPNDALDWRKKSLISITSLPEKRNYPVIKFKYQSNNDDATIGYQKGGFIFYEMMKIIGEDRFFNALKSFAQKYKGKRALWQNLSNAFDEQVKKDSLTLPVKKVMNQWLNSLNVPVISLGKVEMKGDSLMFAVNQDSAFYISLPVEIISDKGKETKFFTIKDKENSIATKIDGKVKSLQLDPYYQALRRLYKWEIPYSFNITLNDNPLLILPSKKTEDYKTSEEFAKTIIESDYKIDYKSIDDISNDDWNNRSIIVLGDEKSNSFYSKLKGKYPDGVSAESGKIAIADKKLTTDISLMMMNYEHPVNADKFMTVIYTQKIDSQEPLKRLFRYLSYSLVVINKTKPGMPQAQMELFPDVKEKKEMLFKFD